MSDRLQESQKDQKMTLKEVGNKWKIRMISTWNEVVLLT
jgi:hypothetical protein